MLCLFQDFEHCENKYYFPFSRIAKAIEENPGISGNA